MKRKLMVAVSAVAFLAVSVGAVVAYFSLTQRVPLGQFQTGSTEVIVTANTVDAMNILPGETQTFFYSIENIGTVPVHVVSQLDPSWSDPLLDPTMVLGDELVVNHGSGYQTIYDNTFAVNNTIFYSDTGNDDAPWELGPGEKWDVQFTVKLDESAGEEYMLATYAVDAVVGVREVGNQVPWPLLQ